MYWIGVDCHKWQHTAAILDERGQLLDGWQGGTSPADWTALADWAADYGAPCRWGLEGSGHHGRGLAQFLVAQGAWVVEVNTTLTHLGRRSRGSRHKNDRQDAAAIAAIVRQQGERLPRIQREDETAILALLTAERDDLQAAATRLRNQLHSLIQQAEPGAPPPTDAARDAALAGLSGQQPGSAEYAAGNVYPSASTAAGRVAHGDCRPRART